MQSSRQEGERAEQHSGGFLVLEMGLYQLPGETVCVG